MSSDTRKLRMLENYQTKDGCSPLVASRAALAFMPLDGVRPGRMFEKAARKLAWQFARASKGAAPEQIDRLARETLTALHGLALLHGERYYLARYEKALSADFSPSDLVVAAGSPLAAKKALPADPNRSARYNRALARSQTPWGLTLQLSGRVGVLGGVGFGLSKLFG
jgi:hypothetical protein